MRGHRVIGVSALGFHVERKDMSSINLLRVQVKHLHLIQPGPVEGVVLDLPEAVPIHHPEAEVRGHHVHL